MTPSDNGAVEKRPIVSEGDVRKKDSAAHATAGRKLGGAALALLLLVLATDAAAQARERLWTRRQCQALLPPAVARPFPAGAGTGAGRPVQAAASTVITRRFPNRARASSSLPIFVAWRGSSMRRTSLSWTPRAAAKALLDSRCSRRAS